MERVLVVALVVLILLVASVLLIGAGTLALTPLMIAIRARQGRHDGSPVYAVMEAEGWAALVTVVLLSVLFIALGVGSLLYEPLRSLWTAPPTPTAVAVFVLTAIAVVISVYLQPKWYQALFVDDEAPFTTERLPDGTIGVSFRKGPTSVPPMQSENSNSQQPSDPHSR